MAQSAAPDLTAYRLMLAGRLDEALPFAEAAVLDAKMCTPAHAMLATILCGLARIEDAERVVIGALQLRAGSADAYDALAHVSISLGKPDRANTLYRRAVEEEPFTSRFLYNFASSERSLGRLTEAEAACNRAIEQDQRSYASYLLRSELRLQTVDSNHVAELESLFAAQVPDERGRITLGYALAKEFDDLGRYDKAFRWFSEAAEIRRRLLAYDVGVDEKKIQRIIDAYSSDCLTPTLPRPEFTRYIFVVGLPRSGTTLLERVLTGLPGVRSNGETDNFSRALLAATPQGDGDIFFRATRADPEKVAQCYAKLARASADSNFIVEKLPLNYLYLGAICRALPGARLLWMNRSPLDSCFAMYRTLFGNAYPFTYDFEDLARYYVAYLRLMRHWSATLKGHLHKVNYEELVGHPEAVGADVAAYCGLKWEPSAIRVEENRQASFTASASQVRQPIYNSSIGRWRNYGVYLEPLQRRLRELGVDVE